jgi:hypothetical protein
LAVRGDIFTFPPKEKEKSLDKYLGLNIMAINNDETGKKCEISLRVL